MRLFAVLRERGGKATLVREVEPGATVGTVWAGIVAELPALAPFRERVRFAVNGEYVDTTYPLADNDEVAIVPPVSGGLVPPPFRRCSS